MNTDICACWEPEPNVTGEPEDPASYCTRCHSELPMSWEWVARKAAVRVLKEVRWDANRKGFVIPANFPEIADVLCTSRKELVHAVYEEMLGAWSDEVLYVEGEPAFVFDHGEVDRAVEDLFGDRLREVGWLPHRENGS